MKLLDHFMPDSDAVTLDALDKVAAVLGCEPWHLLLPDTVLTDQPGEPISIEGCELVMRLRRLLGGGSA